MYVYMCVSILVRCFYQSDHSLKSNLLLFNDIIIAVAALVVAVVVECFHQLAARVIESRLIVSARRLFTLNRQARICVSASMCT